MTWQQLKDVALTLVLMWCVKSNVAQDCLQGAVGQIPFLDLGPRGSIQIPSGSQAIVTSYRFQCCGDITEWQARMQPGGVMHSDGVYTVHFQVWRPTLSSGCYSMVGENRFPAITLSSGRLASESPDSSDRIAVKPGDVLGYFVFSSTTTPRENEGIQMHPNFTTDAVFYASLGRDPLPLGPAACPVSVGPGGVLSLSVNAAPVVRVSISESECPSPSPSITMTSSSTFPVPVSPTPQVPIQTPPPAPRTTLPPATPNIPPPAPPPATSVVPPPDPEPTTVTIAASTTQTTDEAAPGQGVNDHSTTDTVKESSAVLPATIGVVSSITILTATLVTLVVVVAIIRRKASKRIPHSRDENIYKGKDAYSTQFPNKPYDVITDANLAYGCCGEVDTTTHLPAPSDVHQQQDTVNSDHLYATVDDKHHEQTYVTARDIPVETNQCYGTTTSSVDLIYTVLEEKHPPHTNKQQTPCSRLRLCHCMKS